MRAAFELRFELERALSAQLVGELLHDLAGEVLAEVRAGGLISDHFRMLGHRAVFEAIVALADRGATVELFEVWARMIDSGTAKRLGDVSDLAQLFDLAASAALAPLHARALRRAMLENLRRDLLAQAAEAGTLVEVRERIEAIEGELESLMPVGRSLQ